MRYPALSKARPILLPGEEASKVLVVKEEKTKFAPTTTPLAQMAESVDALVSNTNRAICTGSSPVLGTFLALAGPQRPEEVHGTEFGEYKKAVSPPSEVLPWEAISLCIPAGLFCKASSQGKAQRNANA